MIFDMTFLQTFYALSISNITFVHILFTCFHTLPHQKVTFPKREIVSSSQFSARSTKPTILLLDHEALEQWFGVNSLSQVQFADLQCIRYTVELYTVFEVYITL